MTQPGLIQKVIEATGMSGCNQNRTPAAQVCLGSDVDRPPMKEKWSYLSLVGMLLYLLTNTRPDITYAVSQVAPFCSNPKQPHASAIKMIVMYLAGQQTRVPYLPQTTTSKSTVTSMPTSLVCMDRNLRTIPSVQDRGQATSCSFVVAHCCGNHNCRVRWL